MNLKQSTYRPDIDGLRAVAILAVVSYHAFPGRLPGGFIGVDVFFVISGFLISSILMKEMDTRSFKLLHFYSKRINRLYPALMVVMLCVAIFGWVALLPLEYSQLGKHMAGGAAFVSNLVLWNEVGYFDNSAETKPLLHLWSLGVEEQFYILWPIVLFAAYRYRAKIPVAIVIALISSFVICISIIDDSPANAFYFPHARFWELLVGSFLAWFSMHFVTPKRAGSVYCIYASRAADLKSFASFAGAALIVLGLLFTSPSTTFPGWAALIPVLGAALLIYAGPNAYINKHILSNRVAVWFGLISYPLYLWHWPLLTLARIVEDEHPSRDIRVTAVLVSIVLAWLTYHFVESPLRRKTSLAKSLVLFCSMSAIGVAGYVLYVTGGAPQRLEHQQEVAKIFDMPYPPIDVFPCAGNVKGIEGSEFNNSCFVTKESPPTMAFIGDSHANHFKNALPKYFPDESVLMVSHTKCLPFSAEPFMREESCGVAYRAATQVLKENPNIRTVYFSGYWGYLMTAEFSMYGSNWRLPAPLDEEKIASFRNNAIRMLDIALESDRQVVFMKDIPDLNFDIKTCFDYRPFRLTQKSYVRSSCSMSFEEYKKRTAPYEEQLEDILSGYPQVAVYDPTSVFCRNGECIGADALLPLYMNGDHVNHYGADLVIRDMVISLGKN